MTDDIVNSAISTVRTEAEAGADAGVNFARFGMPIATGRRSALFSVNPGGRGSRVVSVFPYGTAARAQLQAGDQIVSLDGQDLSNRSAAEIQSLSVRPRGEISLRSPA